MKQDEKATNDSEADAPLVNKDTNNRQADEANQKTRWHNNISITIAVMALLLSFGTTIFSYLRIKDQDLQNTKAELRGLLQRLSVLPKEYSEAFDKRSKNPYVEGAIQDSVSQENALLSRQAADLAKKLPRHQVSAAEWLSIASALHANNEHNEALEFLGYALENANNFYIEVVILRAKASLLFNIGQAPEGRNIYLQAIAIFSKYTNHDEGIQNLTTMHTYMNWAASEANNGKKDETNKYLAEAKTYLDKLPRGPRIKGMEDQFNNWKTELNSEGQPKDQPLTTESDDGSPDILVEMQKSLQRIESILSSPPPVVRPKAERDTREINPIQRPRRQRPRR